MKAQEVGLCALLGGVFFAVLAAGHVQLDALPDEGGAIGILLTLPAVLIGVACLFGLKGAKEGEFPWRQLVIAVVVAYLAVDVLLGGALLTTVRVFVALLVLGGLAWTLYKHRVVQMPTVLYAGFLALLVASLGVSILVSEFRSVSVDAWINWLLYAAAFYLTIAVLGRVRGPRLLAETVVLAGTVVALKGVFEYVAVRAEEPTYRIFADWNNPNALAGLLVTVLPLALALGALSRGPQRALLWAAAAVLVAALGLTQSLGGLLTAPIGVVAFAIAALAWRQPRALLPALVPVAAGVLLLLVVKAGPRPSAPETSGTPAVASEQASSSRYRLLLWQGAIEQFQKQPVGIGVGTYRFSSAKSGLNEQTHLAHQTFLQVGLEGGAIALIGLVGLGLAWAVRMYVGARALDPERNLLRAGVFGAVVACAANGFLESNLYYFGLGLLFFVLLAAGLQLAADGTTPESLPASLRGFLVVACCGVPLAGALWAMYLENAKSNLLTALRTSDARVVEPARDSLRAIAGPDGEAWYLLAWTDRELGEQKLAAFKKAVALAPSTRHLRGLAQAQADLGQDEAALQTLDQALEYDENNLRTLMQKLRIEERSGDLEAAMKTAARLIAVESKPYMQTRALAELVPTETYEARVFLAGQTTDTAMKKALLREAVEGYARYRRVTVPKVLQFDRQGLDYAGETRLDAEEKMATARAAGEELKKLYSAPEDVAALEELLKGLTVD